jgi:hypothetical protein
MLDPLDRTMLLIRNAGQAAILAKVLLTNRFFAACRMANKSGNQVRRREFPKD